MISKITAMKNTQNASNPQIFQYLRADHVNTPMKYLQWFYGKYKLSAWQERVRLFLIPNAVSQKTPLSDPFDVYQHIVNHIDLAYLIKERGGMTGLAGHFIKGLFDFKPRKDWLETLGQKLVLQSQKETANPQHPPAKGPPIERPPTEEPPIGGTDSHTTNLIELLHCLNYYFYLISIGRSKEFWIPIYVRPDERLVGELLADERFVDELLMNKWPEDADNTPGETGFRVQKRVNIPEWMQLSPRSQAIKHFFDIDSLQGWKDRLWKWYQAALTDDYWSGEDWQYSGAHLLDLYICLCALLEMYRERMETKSTTGNNESPESNSRSIFRERDPLIAVHGEEMITFHYVSPDEARSPLPRIAALVEQYNKNEWDSILYEWLSCGLSINSLGDTSYADSRATRVYQTLAKIIELSYVLAFGDELEYRKLS